MQPKVCPICGVRDSCNFKETGETSLNGVVVQTRWEGRCEWCGWEGRIEIKIKPPPIPVP